MSGLVAGLGSLRYQSDGGVYRLVVEVDPAIVEYSRSLVPKDIRLNRQRYAPHISVVREAALPKPLLWGAHEGQQVEFEYSPVIRTGEVYYWLEAYSEKLGDVREELGFERDCWYIRPPDNAECYHITIGNLKA